MCICVCVTSHWLTAQFWVACNKNSLCYQSDSGWQAWAMSYQLDLWKDWRTEVNHTAMPRSRNPSKTLDIKAHVSFSYWRHFMHAVTYCGRGNMRFCTTPLGEDTWKLLSSVSQTLDICFFSTYHDIMIFLTFVTPGKALTWGWYRGPPNDIPIAIQNSGSVYWR